MSPSSVAFFLRTRGAKWASVAALVVAYDVGFEPAYVVMGPAVFLLALVPCVVAGGLLGVPAALIAIAVTVWLDRSHAIALGLAPGLGLFASVALKLGCGVGVGLFADKSRGLRRANAQLAYEIAERREAEARLLASERLYRALAESLGEGVGVFDKQDRFLFANRTLASILDSTPTQVIGRPLAQFLSPSSAEKLSRAAGRGEGPRSYELQLPGDDPKLLLATETSLDGTASDEACTLRVVRDITERALHERRQRELERQLERSQALQGLAVLAGGVAHDFNNLLSGVVGNADLALRRVPASALELRECLTEIRSFAQEASQLSRQMLAYAGRRSLAMRAVDVNGEVDEALRLVRSTVGAQARLDLRLEPNLPEIVADRAQVRQVITNLVFNAVEAMKDGRGRVSVSTSLHALDPALLAAHNAPAGSMVGSYLCLSVNDDGCGMTNAVREQIFQPYFSTKAQGRGLGLAAAAGIARSHRGWLDVQSTPGEGTRFDFWLPVPRDAAQTTASLRIGERLVVGAGSVLLIDDEPAVRLVTRRLLVELGRRVLTADSGQEGVETFREHHASVDLVLLDLTMPQMSGAEVLTHLCRIDPNVRVVLTSGFQPSGAGDLLTVPNVVGFLEKPHTLANLEALLGAGEPSTGFDPEPISGHRLKEPRIQSLRGASGS